MKKKLAALFLIIAALSFPNSIIRKISVTGYSEKEVMPDTATVLLQIRTKEASLNKATKEASERLEKFKSALRSRKIDLSEIETVSFYSRKQKEYGYENNYNEEYDLSSVKTDRKPSSYTASISVLIKNADFEQVSSLIDFSDGENMQSVQKDYNEDAFTLSINGNDITLDKALTRVFSKLNAVKGKLQASGIQASNVVVGNYSVKENFSTENSGQKDLFYVNHDLKVTTRDIKNLNQIISIADDNGLNIYGSIQFDISDKDKIASEMYNEAFAQSREKATSILKSSSLKLASPIVVSEDQSFQQKMIDKIDESWEIEAASYAVDSTSDRTYSPVLASPAAEMKYAKKQAAAVKIDYTPKPIKLIQNISVMYEMK